MCPSCMPILPILAATASSGGLIFGLRSFLARWLASIKTPERLLLSLQEKNS